MIVYQLVHLYRAAVAPDRPLAPGRSARWSPRWKRAKRFALGEHERAAAGRPLGLEFDSRRGDVASRELGYALGGDDRLEVASGYSAVRGVNVVHLYCGWSSWLGGIGRTNTVAVAPAENRTVPANHRRRPQRDGA